MLTEGTENERQYHAARPIFVALEVRRRSRSIHWPRINIILSAAPSATQKPSSPSCSHQSGKAATLSKVTVADFVRARVDQWEAAGAISTRTAQRYRQLVENQIAPYLGTKMLQKLRPLDMEQWHTILRTGGRVRGEGGVAARTIGHAHRILGKALRDAVRNGRRAAMSPASNPRRKSPTRKC